MLPLMNRGKGASAFIHIIIMLKMCQHRFTHKTRFSQKWGKVKEKLEVGIETGNQGKNTSSQPHQHKQKGGISLSLVNSIDGQFPLLDMETSRQRGSQHLHVLSQHQNAMFVNLLTV